MSTLNNSPEIQLKSELRAFIFDNCGRREVLSLEFLHIIEKVAVLCNPQVNWHKILGILLDSIEPEGDFDVLSHSKFGLNLTKSISQIP